MQRKVLLPALFVVFIIASAASAQTVQRWQNVSSSEGRFEALFPSAPTTKLSSKDTPVGKVHYSSAMADMNDSAFLVMFADWPSPIEDVQGSLAASQNSVVREMNATLVDSYPTNVRGYQALLYKVRIPEANGNGFIGTVLVTFVGRRQYQVIVIQREGKAVTGEAAKFISSFKLTA